MDLEGESGLRAKPTGLGEPKRARVELNADTPGGLNLNLLRQLVPAGGISDELLCLYLEPSRASRASTDNN